MKNKILSITIIVILSQNIFAQNQFTKNKFTQFNSPKSDFLNETSINNESVFINESTLNKEFRIPSMSSNQNESISNNIYIEQQVNAVIPHQNTVLSGSKIYRLPDSLKIVKLPNGLFTHEDTLLGHKVGNGGDYVRSVFIRLGEKVIDFLKTTQAGKNIINNHNLNIDELKETLQIKRVITTHELLFDNTGALVDAIGLPGLIILNNSVWLEHFEKERDIYFLIFHEMLRSSNLDDDNYKISKSIIQFPNSFKLSTRLIPLIPIIEEDSILGLLNLNQLSVLGSGCNKQNEFYAEIDMTQNKIELTFKNFISLNSAIRQIDLKTCHLAVPFTTPSKKQIVISLIDVISEISSAQNNQQTKQTLKLEAFLSGYANKINYKSVNLRSEARTVLFRKTDAMKTRCGEQGILRMNLSQDLKTTPLPQKSIKNNLNEKLNTTSAQVKKVSLYLSLEDCL